MMTLVYCDDEDENIKTDNATIIPYESHNIIKTTVNTITTLKKPAQGHTTPLTYKEYLVPTHFVALVYHHTFKIIFILYVVWYRWTIEAVA